MKAPAALDAMVVRFDRMTLRERLLIFAAVLVAVLMAWQTMYMEKLGQREKSLSAELTELQESVSRVSRTTEAVANSDPTTVALRRLQEREKALDAINAKLAAESAGLIPPAQMVQVIHDVLKHQRGLRLVSLRNLPMSSLVPETKKAAGSLGGEGNASAGAAASADVESVAGDAETASAPADSAQPGANSDPGSTAAVAAPESGPYLHPVEIVVEGRYLDIVAYLRALESLQWHFYWRVLELETKAYPLNRVRIELSTVSLDKEWIGV